LGIDSNTDKLKIINKFGIAKTKNIDAFVFLKDIRRHYDVIMLTCILEHIPKNKMFTFMRLIHKCLNKGGKVIVTVPNMESPLNLRIRYLDFTHESGFTVNSLLHLLYFSNFDNLKIRDQLTKKQPKAVQHIKKLYDALGLRPPLFFAENLIGVGIKK